MGGYDPSRVLQELQAALGRYEYARPQVSFLLGSDEAIGQETRVALTPMHLDHMRRMLAGLGITLRLVVHQGAGQRAGFPDDDYRAVGAEVMAPEDLMTGGAFDVVHALKEPTEYESRLPGPFLRLGALHLASKPGGVCEMLTRRNFAAILDGGTVGSCSYLKHGGDRTPIVASMSRFAGAVAGEKLVEGVTSRNLSGGRIVVVGGGVAGQSAIAKIPAVTGELVVVDPLPELESSLRPWLRELGFERVVFVTELRDDTLEGAAGILFAHRSGASAAEKVCRFEQIQTMQPGASVIDIAIDQGGSILHPGYREEDDVHANLEKYRLLLRDYFYYAETNMPREAPRQASRMHGDASLPYLTLLLAFCARRGGPLEATNQLLSWKIHPYGWNDSLPEDLDLVGSLVQDLRNGLQLVIDGGEARIVHPDIEGDAVLAGWIRQCARVVA